MDGTLVYLDYRTNKETSIPSQLTVTEVNGDKLTWIFEYEYPDEPKANSKKMVKLTTDGTSIDDERVIARVTLDGGVLRLVTKRRGKDNNVDALIRYHYLISKSTFAIKKGSSLRDRANSSKGIVILGEGDVAALKDQCAGRHLPFAPTPLPAELQNHDYALRILGSEP